MCEYKETNTGIFQHVSAKKRVHVFTYTLILKVDIVNLLIWKLRGCLLKNTL